MNTIKVDEMLDPKIEKYLLRKKGLGDVPVGLLKYGEEYHKAKGDSAKQKIIRNMIDREISTKATEFPNSICSILRFEIYENITIGLSKIDPDDSRRSGSSGMGRDQAMNRKQT